MTIQDRHCKKKFRRYMSLEIAIKLLLLSASSCVKSDCLKIWELYNVFQGKKPHNWSWCPLDPQGVANDKFGNIKIFYPENCFATPSDDSELIRLCRIRPPGKQNAHLAKVLPSEKTLIRLSLGVTWLLSRLHLKHWGQEMTKFQILGIKPLGFC